MCCSTGTRKEWLCLNWSSVSPRLEKTILKIQSITQFNGWINGYSLITCVKFNVYLALFNTVTQLKPVFRNKYCIKTYQFTKLQNLRLLKFTVRKINMEKKLSNYFWIYYKKYNNSWITLFAKSFITLMSLKCKNNLV